MSATLDRAKALVDRLREMTPAMVNKALQDVGLMVWRGEFHAAESYRPGDIVRSNSRLWVALRQTSGLMPAESSSWDVVALGQEAFRADVASPNIVSAKTADKNGIINALNVTTCWGILPNVITDYLTGVSVTINGTPVGVSNPVVLGNCITYDIDTAVQPDDVVRFLIDNSSGNWTYQDDEGKKVDDQDVLVTNLYIRPVVQSATVNSDGTEVSVQFDINVDDDGGSGPYTGDAQLQADGSDLTIESVTGNGTKTLVYAISETVYQGQTVEWTANAISFSGSCP